MTDLTCGTCGDPAVGVCSVLLAQPISNTYCRRCLREGLESWWVIVATVDVCTNGYDRPPEEWREELAPWAVEIIDRSLAFHGKTDRDLVEAVRA
jgi:hypothetical protein